MEVGIVAVDAVDLVMMLMLFMFVDIFFDAVDILWYGMEGRVWEKRRGEREVDGSGEGRGWRRGG